MEINIFIYKSQGSQWSIITNISLVATGYTLWLRVNNKPTIHRALFNLSQIQICMIYLEKIKNVMEILKSHLSAQQYSESVNNITNKH